jgi:hypothetical protein
MRGRKGPGLRWEEFLEGQCWDPGVAWVGIRRGTVSSCVSALAIVPAYLETLLYDKWIGLTGYFVLLPVDCTSMPLTFCSFAAWRDPIPGRARSSSLDSWKPPPESETGKGASLWVSRSESI